jgi:hypothetical protein
MVTFPPVPVPTATAASPEGVTSDSSSSRSSREEQWGAGGRWHIDGTKQAAT